MSRRCLLVCCFLALALPARLPAQEKKPRPKLPNIIWITSEDHGPHMGCYGDKFARTPNVDKLAKKGMIFTHCWSNAPVCAPARTTIISGLYPPSTGAEHMRSLTRLPNGFRMFPHYLRALGYYCANHIKEDYNLEKDGKVWDDSSKKAHWKNRQEGQPFFAVFNSLKSHESQIRNPKVKLVGDPLKVRIPSYHPDTPEVREDWTRYYDIIALADADAGELLRELAEAGLLEDTIIFYFADHGSGMPRHKRTPLNSGLHVPLVVYFPDNWIHLAPPGYRAGGRSDRLVSFVDLAPTMLSIAGIEAPPWMQGHAFAGKHLVKAPAFLHGFRGRMDERYDFQRSLTDGRYVYLRNYLPHLPAGQHVDYMFQTKTTQVWKKLYDAGKLDGAQKLFWTSPRKPEELYDLQSDPDEVKNLAGSPEHQKVLVSMRKAQRAQVLKIRDVGFLPEDEIHLRSALRTPYEMGHDKERYPLERILDMAERASSLQADAVPKLRAGLKADDSAIRYWSALGLLMRGKDAVTEHTAALRNLWKDESKPVRIVAAEALGQFGTKDDVAVSLKVLLEAGDPTKNSIYNSLAALNALDRLGEKARPALKELQAWPTQGTPAAHRAAPGIARLLAKINGQLAP
jgi:arylsulfatase A-like enzyme